MRCIAATPPAPGFEVFKDICLINSKVESLSGDQITLFLREEVQIIIKVLNVIV